MQRITRYLLGELCLVFCLTLVAMTVLLVLGIMAKEGVRQGLGIHEILRLLPYSLPGALRFSVPATILMATCIVFGRMSADNEIIALKSLGIQPLVLLWPALGLAIAVSLSAVWLNDLAVTWGTNGIYRVIAESVESVLYRTLSTQGSYTADGISIIVNAVQGDRLLEPTIVLRSRTGTVTLVAREASLKSDLGGHRLLLRLRDGMIEKDGRATYAFPDTYQHEIPLSELTRRIERDRSPSEIAMESLPGETEAEKKRLRELGRQMAVRATMQFALGDFADLNDEKWRSLHAEQRGASTRLNRLRLEPWRRFANGFSCLFFVIVGAPLAIRLRTSNFFNTFAICFLPILVVYYPLLMLSVDRAKDGAMPPYSVWLANVVLLLAGCLLQHNIRRH